MLRESLLKEIERFGFSSCPIIFDNRQHNDSMNIDSLDLIVKITETSFRVFHGLQHSDGFITINSIYIYNDMLKSMVTK